MRHLLCMFATLTVPVALAACLSAPASDAAPASGGSPGEVLPAPVEGGEAVAANPVPITPGSCSPTSVATEKHPIVEGESVTLSGTIEHSGDASGNILMDFWVTAEEGFFTTEYFLVCGGPGAFSAVVPRNLGEVHLVAHLDAKGDGPTKGDPVGQTPEPIVIAKDSIEGISIVLGNEPLAGFPYAYSKAGQDLPAPTKPAGLLDEPKPPTP